MKRVTFVLLFFLAHSCFARESLSGMEINSSKDLLSLIRPTGFAHISFADLKNEIKAGENYHQSVPYSLKHAEWPSVISQQVDGSIDFGSFEMTIRGATDITKVQIEKYMSSIGLERKGDQNVGLSYAWKQDGFTCSLIYQEAPYNEIYYFCQTQ